MPFGNINIYTFRNGKLNDTTYFFYRNKKLKRYIVYNDNIIVYQLWYLIDKTEANYDQEGFAHGPTNVYGKHRRFLFIFPYYIDSYKGKIYQRNTYEHGNLIETTIFRKDGSVKKNYLRSYKKIKYHKKENKNCL